MAFCALVNFAGFLSIKLGKSHLFKCTNALKKAFFILVSSTYCLFCKVQVCTSIVLCKKFF